MTSSLRKPFASTLPTSAARVVQAGNRPCLALEMLAQFGSAGNMGRHCSVETQACKEPERVRPANKGQECLMNVGAFCRLLRFRCFVSDS
jgi:hypothetical protein